MASNALEWISTTIVVSMVAIATVMGIGSYRVSRSLGIHKMPASLAVGVFLMGWLVLALVLGMQGFFRPNPAVSIPNIAYSAIPLVIGYGLASGSTALRKTVEATPPQWIIGVQVYRTLGIVFLILYAQQRLPGVFAVPAGVGDMIIGITAPLVAYLHFAKQQWARGLAILWNVAGIADLILAVTLGFLSSPGPFQLLALDSPNELITSFPLVLIPTFAVPLSILLHLLSLRVLLSRKR